MEKKGIFDKIKNGLNKTRENISSRVNGLLSAFHKIDEEFFEELEETLILSDMGTSVSSKIIEELKDKVKEDKLSDPGEIKTALKEIIAGIIRIPAEEITYPAVFLVVGVNGVGKTTAIGKLAQNYKSEGRTVTLAAADTFRAAASEQLTVWADRAGVPIIKYSQEGADPAAVVYDAIDSCKAKKTDLLICDTAGRLHNKKNLMAELQKIKKVIDRDYPEARRETFLVIDATTGQNALSQARIFSDIVDISGIILTKLDGTAKGGIVCAIIDELKLPVRFIGVGEGINDLQPFSPEDFAQNLID
jgi:fused signal recognition particle receptor